MNLIYKIAFILVSAQAVSQTKFNTNQARSLSSVDIASRAESKASVIAELQEPVMSALDLKWDQTPQQIEETTKQIKIMGNQQIARITKAAGARTYENTIEPLNQFEAWWSSKITPIGFLVQVSDKKDIREAAKVFEKEMSDFNTDLWMREDLYQALKAYVKTATNDKSFYKLNNEQQRYVNKTLEDFETQGMKLPINQRKKLIQLTKEVSDLESQAEANIAEDKSKAEFKTSELKGIPQKIIDKLPKVDGKPNTIYLNTKKGNAALQILEDENTLKKLDGLIESSVADKNIPIINQLIQKRDTVAKMLGYSSNSEMILQDKMAGNIQNVEKLLDDLTHKITNQGRREKELMQDFKRQITGNKEAKWEHWDRGKYENKFDAKMTGFKESQITDYFPAEHVKKETLNIYQELLSLKFNEIKDAKTWHKEVSMYEVKDKKSDKLLGHFYLDLYPRPDKFNHAACMTILKRNNNHGQFTPAAAAMVSNFDKMDSGNSNEPITLSHHEVVTFFHEFGHVMHNMCNEANFNRFTGASVEKDFVEMPSQMLENWIWDKDIIKRMSKHKKTGKQIPDDLLNKKLKSKNLHIAEETLGQIFYSTVDLILNSSQDKKLLAEDPAIKKHSLVQNKFVSPDENIDSIRRNLKIKDGNIDLGDIWRKLAYKIESVKLPENANPIAKFGHLISGYVSGYYSYIWAQVYSDDLYDQFEKVGVMNPEMGMKYRKTILAPGGSRDSIESLRLFLGREPNQEAFLKRNNFNKGSEQDTHKEIADKEIAQETDKQTNKQTPKVQDKETQKDANKSNEKDAEIDVDLDAQKDAQQILTEQD